MLSCHKAWESLPEFLSGQLPAEEIEALQAHLRECPDCSAQVEELSQVWKALDRWLQEAPPPEASQAIRRVVRMELAQERVQGLFPAKKLLWAIVDGLLFALGSVVVMAGVAGLEGFSAPVLLSSGALWSALYILAFALYFRSEGQSGSPVNLKAIALAGLLTITLSLAAARTLSVSALVRHCELSPWGAALLERLGKEGAYLVFGGLYALMPLLLVSFALGERVRGRPLLHGLFCAGLFFFLALPAIYLQCGAFSLGVGLSWVAGALLGSVVGAPLGFWLRGRLREGIPPYSRA